MSSLKHSHSRSTFLTSIPHHTCDLYLRCCGMQSCPPHYSYGPAIRMQYLIHFVQRGQGNYYINGKNYEVHQNQFFFIPPGIPVEYCADAENPWDYLWFGFHGANAATCLEQAGLTLDTPVQTFRLNPVLLSNIIEKIFHIDQTTLPDELDRIGCLYELLALLCDSYQSDQPPDNVQHLLSKKHTVLAIQYIERSYASTTVSEIADYLGLNRTYLHTLFKREFNLSPQQYLIQYRMHIALEKLSSSEETIQEIAFQIGYQDAVSFFKIFKKQYGISPQHYRETQKKQAL